MHLYNKGNRILVERAYATSKSYISYIPFNSHSLRFGESNKWYRSSRIKKLRWY